MTQQSQNDFEYPSCDFNFDFDFDLRLSAFDYLLLGLYAVFVLPIVLLSAIVIKPVREYMRKRKETSKDANKRSGSNSPVPLGPCCNWPRGVNR